MKKLILAFSMLILGAMVTKAQKFSIQNVQKLSLRNSDAIKEGSEVKGYYFFYISDKIDKKTNEYTLQITDNNLNKLKDVKFQDSKYVTILESSFNGSDLIFLFYNADERTFEYQVYGADGKKKHSYLRQLTKKDEAYITSNYQMSDEEQDFKGLYPIDGQGFISNTPSREDKDYTFQIDFFASDKKKQWAYIPTDGAKRFTGEYLGYNNGVIYLSVLKYTKTLDQNPDSYVVGLSIETGKQIFEKPTDKSEYQFYPTSMTSMINGKCNLFGEYYSPKDNIMKDRSRGFAFWPIDEKGNIGNEKYISWDLQLGKYLDVNSRGKIDDFGYMYLHNMAYTDNGDIYAIGEGFKKSMSAAGATLKILSGRLPSASKIKVSDLLLIKFDKELNVKSATIYPKKGNNIEVGPFGIYRTALLGKIIKYYFGGFDYAYTQYNSDKSSFTVCYSDYVKGKDYKGGTFNSITYNEGKITTDRINTKSDATTTSILPGKQGQVLIMEYYRKDKRLDVHFEKLN